MCNFQFIAALFLISLLAGVNAVTVGADDAFITKGLDVTATVDPTKLVTGALGSVKNLLADTWGHKEDVAHASLRRLICPIVADLLDSIDTSGQVQAAEPHNSLNMDESASENSGLLMPKSGDQAPAELQKKTRKLSNVFGLFRHHGKRGSKIEVHVDGHNWADLTTIDQFKSKYGKIYTTTGYTGVVQAKAGEENTEGHFKDIFRKRALYARQTVLTVVNQLEEALYFVARQKKQWWNYGRQRSMNATKLQISQYIAILDTITKNLQASYADMIKLDMGSGKIDSKWFGEQKAQTEKILRATFHRCQAKPNDDMQAKIIDALSVNV